MFDASLDLRRTTCIVGTIPRCLTLITHQRGATLRTTLDKLHRHGDDRPLVDVHPHNLGDDLTTFLHIDIIADMQIKALDKVLIVQRGTFHSRTSQLHRIHIGYRRDGPCTSHLIGHLIQSGTHALSLELIGDGPTGTLGRKSQGALLS